MNWPQGLTNHDPGDKVRQASLELTELEWEDQLLKVIKKMRPDSFECLCQRLLRESGFIQVEVSGKSNDGGIDGMELYA